MSNLMHKVKEAVNPDKHSHASNTKTDNARADNLTSTAGTTGVGGTSGITNTTHGANTHSTTAGPHSSNVANQLDPRVATGTGSHATTGVTSGGHSNPNTYGTTGGVAGDYNNPRSTNAGPHGSNIANMADPRVDSDRSKIGNTGGVTSGGMTSGVHNVENPRSTNAGPHGSNIANMADPRVDSDRSHTGGMTSGMTSGTHNVENPRSTNAGPHGSNIANVVDPRVDSDRSQLGNTGGMTNRTTPGTGVGLDNHNQQSGVAPAGSSYTTPGSGAAQNTAGPHNSDLLNKLDPRVDSDLDNSRTIGGDATRR